MASGLHQAGRWLHLGSGFAAVGLGLVVMLLPKFGRRAAWHRWTGRVYAALIAGSSLLGVSLAFLRDNNYLMILGTVTFAMVAMGWWDGRVAKAAAARGESAFAARRLRQHLVFMGASYIGAWSGFFATNPIFGSGEEWQVWAYVFGPSIVGAAFIARAAARLGERNLGRPSEPFESRSGGSH